MNNQRNNIFVFLFLLLLCLSGCAQINRKLAEKMNKTKSNYTNYTTQNIIEEYYCPECNCTVIDETPDLDKVTYLFNSSDLNSKLNEFVSKSSRKLFCQFIKLEDDDIAENIMKAYNKKVNVKIMLDEDATTDFCEDVCVPKLESQYNYLFANGVSVRLKNVYSTFCLNEYGVFIINEDDYALYIESKRLPSIFENKFLVSFNAD